MRFISKIRGFAIGLFVAAGLFAGFTGATAFHGDPLAGSSNPTSTTDDTPWD